MHIGQTLYVWTFFLYCVYVFAVAFLLFVLSLCDE